MGNILNFMNKKVTTKYCIIITSLLLLLIAILLAVLGTLNQPNNNSNLQATSQYYLENPSPLPDFINSIRTVNEPENHLLCLIIWQGAFWNKGDDPKLLQSHLIDNSILILNNQNITNKGGSVLGVFPRDKNGNITEDFGADIEFCFTLTLPKGVYTATFQTTSLNGTQKMYSIGIQINDTGSIDLSKLLYAADTLKF